MLHKPAAPNIWDGRLCRLKNNEWNDFVKAIVKRGISAITTIALTLSCILVFDMPPKELIRTRLAQGRRITAALTEILNLSRIPI